jgi:hypothetical protein
MIYGQPDFSLHLEGFFPAAGANVTLSCIDPGVDSPGFSNKWRQSWLRVSWTALPNHVDPSKIITVALVDSGDDGVTFASGAAATTADGRPYFLPTIEVLIPGVANGAPAGFSDFPWPPGLRGPVGILVTVPVGTGDLTGIACLLSATVFFG